MFKVSVREMIFVLFPALVAATLVSQKEPSVQLIVAAWGGWLGALLWFVILRGEYINPMKFLILFMVLPGFLFSASYFTYRQPIELRGIQPRLQYYHEHKVDADNADFRRLEAVKNKKLFSLYKDCAWIWLVGSVLAALIFAEFYVQVIYRFDYAYRDSLRSRAELGKKPVKINPADLPPKTAMVREEVMTIESDKPMKIRFWDLISK